MKTVYFSSTGKSDPTRASIALHLAVNGSVEIGDQVAVIFGGDAAEVVSEETIQTLEGVGLPPFRELVEKARKHDVAFYV